MAAVDNMLPLQNSNTFNASKKTIEETYQKKSQLEHILLRPDTYIGSIEKHTQTLWVYDDDEGIVCRSITYVPGLYKIFDEILVNAADNKQRDPSMNSVKVDIDAEQNCISVYNNGDGVPVEIHQQEGIYVPELIFGHLLTSSNYDDTEKKTTGGRNGFGAKLTNIFSTEFIIQTADSKRQRKYKQVFTNNMGHKSAPSITKCKEGENWTKVTFKPDLAKFNMSELEADVVALMKKRVYDLAGCLGKTVKVELNGKLVPVKSFQDYVDFYLKSAAKSRNEESLPRITEKVNGRWEVCVSLSDGHFQQVSFVNGIATIKGGTHVEYVTGQVANHLVNIVKKQKKDVNVKPQNVKNYLWVFVNALIDNPAFDSQTKENLTTKQASFGSKCELSPEFLKKVAKSGVVDNLLTWVDFKRIREMKKTDGKSGSKRINDIKKLEEANLAGKAKAEDCTLILTEGDSAKALAKAGISVVGSDTYGVFPLRGKLLNVREATHKQIMDNAEIQHIKRILGLQQGKQYESVKGLRYGHLMIMTDQDHDGSHIKGLLINLFHTFWPSLLRIPSFLVEFITPIVKATHKSSKKVISFYSMPEFESWKESVGDNPKQWSTKYYKGLGTSTAEEGKDYFRDINQHMKEFVWEDEQDGDLIELAFSKKKIDARKNWLRQFEPGTYLDQKDTHIKYKDFINKELILFSVADLQRSIPSIVDGLKPGQRKILFCAFKKGLTKEIKVQQFSGYVSEHSAYHHGEQSLATTIIGMAQNFVGSNNINLFLPNGQFGTRHQGGKDHASARYVFTALSPLTRFLFPADDDVLLDYLTEDGQSIEPAWYIPILPTVLVNGSEGIGTGWSSYIPNYNPRDLVANVRCLLDGEPMQPMDPWYKGFKGLIEKSVIREAGASYNVSGIIEEVDETTLRITELPIRRWTEDYKEFLESMMPSNEKNKDSFVQDFVMHNGVTTVHFEVTLSEENMRIARDEGFMKKFKLTSTISTSNMHLFDAMGHIKKYDKPEQILEEFFHLRLEYYVKRRRAMLDNLELQLLILDNKVRFILAVVNGEIVVSNRKRADLFIELKEKGFTPFPGKAKKNTAADSVEAEESEENDEHWEMRGGVKENDYAYLLNMPIGTLTLEKVQKLLNEKQQQEDKVEELKKETPKSLWIKDLDAFMTALDEQDKRDAAEAENVTKGVGGKLAGRGKQVGKKPRKNTKKANNEEPVAEASISQESSPSDMVSGNVAEAVKPRGRGAAKKNGAKKAQKATVVDNESDDEEIPALKERLAAFHLESSSDSQSAMETEVPTKRESSKRAASQKSTTVTVLSDSGSDKEHMEPIPEEIIDKDEDEVFEPAATKGGNGRGRGRKAATAANAQGKVTIAARKRGGVVPNKPILGQKTITEVLKPGENERTSPEKKVRKMRPSPFNKKSGSILGRTNSSESSSPPTSGSQEGESTGPVLRARSQRNQSRATARYILSDDSEDDDDDAVEVTDDSDFDGDDED